MLARVLLTTAASGGDVFNTLHVLLKHVLQQGSGRGGKRRVFVFFLLRRKNTWLRYTAFGGIF